MITADNGELLQVRHERVTTTDPEEADALITAAYTDHRAETFGDKDRFAFAMSTTAIGPLHLARTRHSMGFIASSHPADGRLIVVSPSNGARLRMSSGRQEASGSAMLAPTWAPFTAQWNDITFTTVTLDEPRVARLGAEIGGLEPEQVTFAGMTPLSPALASYWLALVSHLWRDVSTMESLPPLLVSEIVRQVAVGLLTVFPNALHTHRPRSNGRDTGEPATVRRAMGFIDANAQRDIDITEIAEAAGIGVRGLQSAFRRHRDQTPLEYLRRVRVEGAHRDLKAGDSTRGDTVADIAARWGFTHAGRFSVEYRRAFGCTPSHTLRR